MPFKDYEYHLQHNRETRNRRYQEDEDYRNQRRQAAASRRAEIAAWVETQKTPCAACGEADPVCLDFHHVDPATKSFSVRGQGRSISRERLEEEIKKCVVLCSNCHRREHARLRKPS